MKEVIMWTLSNDKTWQQLEQRWDWIRAMRDTPQDTRHHGEGNVAIHTQMVLAALEREPAFRLLPAQEQEILWTSALLHDVEKYSTTVKEPDGSITARGHARKGALTTRQILYRGEQTVPPPFAIREQIVGLVRYHGLPLWILEKKDPVKTLISASLEVNTQWLALLARADAIGRICADQADLLYRIDCFELLCREHNCWGNTRPFVSSHAFMHYMQREDAAIDYVPFELPEMEVILMSGLPGAGKDTFIKKHFPHHPVISLDQIRVQWKIDPTDKAGNGRVIQEAKEQARTFLRREEGFVWNGTNTTRQMRLQLSELFMSYRAKVRIVYVETPYARLPGQNKGRDAMVPQKVIERLIDKLEVPALWEGHTVEFHAG